MISWGSRMRIKWLKVWWGSGMRIKWGGFAEVPEWGLIKWRFKEETNLYIYIYVRIYDAFQSVTRRNSHNNRRFMTNSCNGFMHSCGGFIYSMGQHKPTSHFGARRNGFHEARVFRITRATRRIRTTRMTFRSARNLASLGKLAPNKRMKVAWKTGARGDKRIELVLTHKLKLSLLFIFTYFYHFYKHYYAYICIFMIFIYTSICVFKYLNKGCTKTSRFIGSMMATT